MINTQDIRKIVKLTLLSSYIKNAHPLSLFVVGKSGNGKTETIMHYKTKRAEVYTDLSYYGLLKELKKHEKIKHVIIPDFLKLTMKSRNTSNNLLSFLLALTEEGVSKVAHSMFNEDLKGRRIGIIVATTKASFTQNKKKWDSMGLVSRMITCSYDYKDETIEKILAYINAEKYLDEEKFERIMGFKNTEIKYSEKLNKQLNPIVNKKFRTLKQLQTLAKCNALDRKSHKVEQKDIDEIIRLSEYLNLNYNKI